MPDFPYVNARVRAMRSRLLDPARLEELLALPTLDAFIQALTSTPYGPQIQEALSRHQDGLRVVDEALARNFHDTTTKILSFADGKARALIEIVLMRWDLANIRLILRGKHTGRPEEEMISNLAPAGSLHEVVLQELVKQPDVPGVVGALAGADHPLAAPLAEGLRDYRESKDLLALELHLDRFYAEYGLRVASGRGHSEQVVRSLLQTHLDVTNVKTALKLQRAGALSAEEKLRFFVPGGPLVTDKVFLTMTDPATAEQRMPGLRAQGFPIKSLNADLTAFERELDLATFRTQSSLYLGDPLAIDIVIAYLAMKYHEVINLRLIARSKALGIPQDRVRKEMAVV